MQNSEEMQLSEAYVEQEKTQPEMRREIRGESLTDEQIVQRINQILDESKRQHADPTTFEVRAEQNRLLEIAVERGILVSLT